MVVYQIYPRSFQDSDGDGVGDLRGIEQRLDHLSWLGVDALWLSPTYPSPQADMGYDVADFEGVDPAFGTLDDFDRLLAAAHDRGLKLLMDMVPCHTSIEHPWFRDHPERYIWSPVDGPPNNWVAAFGGSAWSPDPHGRGWYLHSFYPEQPDLDWRNPDTVAGIQRAIRFWIERGVDGFRLDAIHSLMKDPELRDDPPARGHFGLPLHGDYARLDHVHSANSPDIAIALAALREAAGDALLVGEVFLPAARLAPYLEHVDMTFAFELFFAAWERDSLATAIEAGARLGRAAAWVLSNHDFARLPDRYGAANVRAAAMLALTLPGTAFIYQGDEIGQPNGSGAKPPFDRAGRDPYRHPMQWDATPAGGFTDGVPWLPLTDPQQRNVAAQRDDAGSLLTLYRELIAIRRRLPEGGFELLRDADPGVLAYRRGDHLVAINLTSEERRAPPHGEPLLATAEGAGSGLLPPHAGAIAQAL
ncbi:MAG: alpha-glucosidase [Thermoleophilaceae bacterium]|nr:alpha-glucosidase [Thermoleophilaceae bacterium]